MSPLVTPFPDIIAIIPAAGIGKRMGIALPKQYLTINDKTLLEYVISGLLKQPRIREIIIAINPMDHWCRKLPVIRSPRVRIVIGGKTRADSVMAALRVADEGMASWILVHDAVRPCTHQDDLLRLLEITAHTDVGGLLATPVRDTMKRAQPGTNIIARTIKREELWHALTPQLLVFELLRDCLGRAIAEGVPVTDEASALEHFGYAPLLVPGRADNIKITYQEDLAVAATSLQKWFM